MQQKQHLETSKCCFYCILCKNKAPGSIQGLLYCCFVFKIALRNFGCYFAEILLLTVQLNNFRCRFEPSSVLFFYVYT
ncbi:hypothetical protein CISIN_1g042140mg [Citrus sinensis]|uniref:Uncharacterized protein n=1 Tax=Citrus sinensis TaxID=2711 RepID=A0A067F9N6_CITSI|nr:hypothetical protein CISIN_1g042140mg [Citrus sinensis]